MTTPRRAVELTNGLLLETFLIIKHPKNSYCFLSVPCEEHPAHFADGDTEAQKGAGPWLSLSPGLGGQS